MLSHAWSYVRRFRYCKLHILKFWAGWDQKNNSKRCCGIQGFQNKKDFCWWDTNFCYWRSGISYHFLFEIHRIPLKILVTRADIMVIKLVYRWVQEFLLEVWEGSGTRDHTRSCYQTLQGFRIYCIW